MTIETEPSDSKKWQLWSEFTADTGLPIKCDRENCSLGVYVLRSCVEEGTVIEEDRAPACKTCEFNGSLGDVFNPNEPRFKEGAPEDFKVGAARVLSEQRVMDIIRRYRPQTATIIDLYASIDGQ